ncbi:tRNA (adenosine(37)-N6)-threonylcarbamoyltransferase complex dimerization subunit type 1 TsaB [Candidatus Margulisiibacteriota bacterium]
MKLLIIDVASSQPSVSLIELLAGGQYSLCSSCEIPPDRCAELLIEKIQSLFNGDNQDINAVPSSLKTIDLIAVTVGPGSWTGLRIGVTVAKTLAWGLKIPLIGIRIDAHTEGEKESIISESGILDSLISILRQRIEDKQFDDPFHLLPYYDKEPNITTPKKVNNSLL